MIPTTILAFQEEGQSGQDKPDVASAGLVGSLNAVNFAFFDEAVGIGEIRNTGSGGIDWDGGGVNADDAVVLVEWLHGRG